MIVKRTKHSFSILNIFPYNIGHLMIVPNRHVAAIENLNDNELLDLMKLQNEMIKVMKRRLRPQGFNLGVNMGRFGGAGVRGHIHLHIVPRWVGDTNFIPMIAKTKVISMSLKMLYDRMTK